MNLETINPTFIKHEGFYYLEFDGEFFKGCRRCGGEGHYSHNGEHSRCYQCDNSSAKLGEQLASREAAEKWCHERAVRLRQRLALAEKKRLAEVAKMVAQWEALRASDPDVYDFLMAVETEDAEYDENGYYIKPLENAEKDIFILNMAKNLRFVGLWKPFTPKMIEAVRGSIQRRQARTEEAAAHPAPAGRVAVAGEIVSAKLKESAFGTAYKILVKDDSGFKVWCSIPKAQADEAERDFREANPETGYYGSAVWFVGSENEPEKFQGIKGKRITFTATLEPSRDDASFAFGSRPTKGAWL